jgi:hypothetical protein
MSGAGDIEGVEPAPAREARAQASTGAEPPTAGVQTPASEIASGSSESAQRPRLARRVGDWVLSNLLAGAVLVTAVSTGVSVVITEALQPDTSKEIAAFDTAQDARSRFEAQLTALESTADEDALYVDLLHARSHADDLYGRRDWTTAQTAYAALSRDIADECLHARRKIVIKGVCAAAAAAPVAPAATPAASPTGSRGAVPEQQGHFGVNTFANPRTGAGAGPRIAAAQYVQVACKLYAPTIASVNPDGYWYRIASPPWNGAFYAPANTFMNGDAWSGPYTHNTDFAVPNC